MLAGALAAAVMTGVLCGGLGVLLARLRLSTLVFSGSHAALAGVALAALINANESLVSFAVVLATVLLLGPLSERLRLPLEQVSMVLLSFYTAAALVCIFLNPDDITSSGLLARVFWGSVFAVDAMYLAVLVCLLMALGFFLGWSWPALEAVLYDQRLAEAEGIFARAYTYALVVLAGIAIVTALKIVGSLLVFAVLFNPAAAAARLGGSFRLRMVLGALLGAAAGAGGVGVSFAAELPVGACIVGVSVLILAAAAVVRR
jgi:ABC-type Mn2+/Zn2+ transport system permease subunit